MLPVKTPGMVFVMEINLSLDDIIDALIIFCLLLRMMFLLCDRLAQYISIIIKVVDKLNS